MIVKILGKGCKNCRTLEQATMSALEELELDYTIEKVKDLDEITEYGVMKTPGLVVDEKLISQGRVLTKEEIISLLK